MLFFLNQISFIIFRNVDVSNDQFHQWSSHGKINILELDEEEKRLRRCQILEEKRRRDRNRKQAIRAAHKRRQEEKLMALKVKQVRIIIGIILKLNYFVVL